MSSERLFIKCAAFFIVSSLFQVHFPVSAAHDVPRVPRRPVEPTARREAMHVSPGDASGGAERRHSGEGRGQGRKDSLLAAAKHAGESLTHSTHSTRFVSAYVGLEKGAAQVPNFTLAFELCLCSRHSRLSRRLVRFF